MRATMYGDVLRTTVAEASSRKLSERSVSTVPGRTGVVPACFQPPTSDRERGAHAETAIGCGQKT